MATYKSVLYCIFIAVQLVFVQFLAAEEIYVDESSEKLFISKNAEYYFQKSGMVSPLEQTVSYSSYDSFRKEVFTNDDTLWVRLVMQNNSQTEVKYYLTWSYSRKNILLWTKENARIFQTDGRSYEWLDSYPPAPYRMDYFELSLKPGENEFYLQFDNMDPSQLFLYLWNPKHYAKSNSIDNIVYGNIAGVILIIIFYNLSLYLSFRDRFYLYFIGNLFAGIIAFPFRDHLYHAWSGINISIYPYEFYIFRAIVTTTFPFMLHYVYSFLDLKKDWFNRIAFYFFYICIFASIVSTILGSVFGASVAYMLYFWGLLFVVGREAVKSKTDRKAVWLIFTFGTFLLGSIVENLRVMGYLNDDYRYVMLITVVIQTLVLSFYMAHRVSVLRDEKLLYQKKLLESSEKEAERLEKTVAQRTEELVAANAAKDRFFSILAHDLRSPVASITALLQKAENDFEFLSKEKVSIMHKNSKSVYRLLDDLLVWSKTQNGLLEYKPVAFNASAKIEEILKLFEEQASAKDIRLSFLHDADHVVYADPDMTGAILRNLISNAIKFTRRGGTVDLSAVLENKDVKFIVRDSGIGMDEDKVQKLFLIGEKYESSFGTENEKGSGLGLVIAKEFAEMNGGRITCSSIPEKGSVFWFVLPEAQL